MRAQLRALGGCIYVMDLLMIRLGWLNYIVDRPWDNYTRYIFELLQRHFPSSGVWHIPRQYTTSQKRPKKVPTSRVPGSLRGVPIGTFCVEHSWNEGKGNLPNDFWMGYP